MSQQPQPALPSHASVVVIGGGIMGCSTLYHLAKMGVTDAILVERNQLTSGTTWHSAAQVRALRHSQNLTRMIQYSVELYAQLEEETGQSVGWIQKGSLSLATTPDRLTHIKRQEDLARSYGIDAWSISVDEARERWPLMRTDDVLGAVWSPDDGRVSPSDVCAALIKAAKALGARVYENTAVTGVMTERNRIKGIETDNGTVQCDAIALCAGLWSQDVAAMAGARAPLLACEHFYLLIKPIEGITGNMPTLSDHDSHLYIRDDSGGLLVGCFEPMGKPIKPGTLDKDFAFGLLPEDWDHFEPMMVNALHRLPPLEHAEVKTLLNGPESFTPDGTFMLGETADTQGLFLGCGMNSVGLASGGGAGMQLARCIVHGHTAYDLSDTDARRFAPIFSSVEHLMARAPEVLGTHYDIAFPGKQFKTARNLATMPVHAAHVADSAHFNQSASWERPVFFNKTHEPTLGFGKPDWHDNVAAEVRAAHTNAAVFDASSFAKFDVHGPDAEAFLLHCCSGNVGRKPGTVSYNALLNDRGSFESDLVVMRLTDSHYRLIIGTAHRWADWSRLNRIRAAGHLNVSITDNTEKFALFNLCGPNALSIANSIADTAIPDMPYFRHRAATVAGRAVTAARLSYVGERGVEITCDAQDAQNIYSALRAAGVQPAGLYAQTSMRIEKGFCAMGHELDTDVSPHDVGLGFACRSEGGFIGAEAVAQNARAVNRLRTLIFDNPEAVPIGHEPVVYEGAIVGQTTSASFGHRIGTAVALATVPEGFPETGKAEVVIAGIPFEVSVLSDAAYDPTGERMKGSDA